MSCDVGERGNEIFSAVSMTASPMSEMTAVSNSSSSCAIFSASVQASSSSASSWTMRSLVLASSVVRRP
jgi:hypothetical protein